MKEYYDLKRQAIIDLEKESCDFEKWNNSSNDFSCCRHPDGFYIFLNPDEIGHSDEYKESDPYTVIKNFKNDFHQRRLNCTIELIKDSKTSQNLKLLDLGCGQGHFTEKFKEEFPNYDVYGLDYSISAIDYANSHFKNIDFIVANAYNPPYTDEYFDIVVLNNVWEHVPDPLKLLHSISRILKPNGQLIISTPSRYRFGNLLRVCFGKEILFMSKLHVTEYTIGQIKEQLKFGGYKINKVYSPSIKEGGWKSRIAKPFLIFILKKIKSHHILEATVFYSAIRLPPKHLEQ
jgi:ubiquinone/menaquinone biosynthesis C-methylase UbiE